MDDMMSGKRKQSKADVLALQMLSDDSVQTETERRLQGKTPCRFPDRPVTHFIPTRFVLHQLLLEAAMLSHPTLDKDLGEFKCKKKQ